MHQWMRTSRPTAAAFLVAVLLMLGGCSGAATTTTTTTTTTPTRQSSQALDSAQSAMARGPMLVVVQGNPFDVPDPAFVDRVLEDVRTAMTWSATPRLTSDPAAAVTPSVRVVMTFNTSTVDANVQCHDGTHGGGPADNGAVQVTASFCIGGDPVSSTSGQIGRSSGIEDPQFASLISQVTDDLFPQHSTRFPELGIGVGGSFGVGRGGVSGGGVGVGVGF